MGWKDWRGWSLRRKWIAGIGAVLVVLTALGAIVGNPKTSHPNTSAKATPTATQTTPAATRAPTRKRMAAPKPKPKPKAKPKPAAPKPKPYVRPASFFINVKPRSRALTLTLVA
jgi:outer membrane biosynthesis protein TonB